MKINYGCLSVLAGVLFALASCTPSPDGQNPTCTAGQKMCGTQCANVASDSQNCGACGNACGVGMVCQASQCVCGAGLLSCGGACVPSNASHCGSCTTVCAGTDVCSSGSCQSSCPTGETQCADGACVPPNGGDATHCGGCDPARRDRPATPASA